jgi:hypothetical protein
MAILVNVWLVANAADAVAVRTWVEALITECRIEKKIIKRAILLRSASAAMHALRRRGREGEGGD